MPAGAASGDLTWCAYKRHVSESCDADLPACPVTSSDGVPEQLPNLITNVATTDASVPDTAMTNPIHQAMGRDICL
jgi:hypothetical protein